MTKQGENLYYGDECIKIFTGEYVLCLETDVAKWKKAALEIGTHLRIKSAQLSFNDEQTPFLLIVYYHELIQDKEEPVT